MRFRSAGARVVVWYPSLFALWLLFVGEWTGLVAVWGVGLSLVAVVAAQVVARQGMLAVQGRWRWAPEVASAAKAVVVDFAILTGALLVALARRRRRVGVWRFDASAKGASQLSAGRRAWVTVLASWSPNCYVVDIDPDTGRRLMHDLRPRRSSEQPT